jgi:hypothetical protein
LNIVSVTMGRYRHFGVFNNILLPDGCSRDEFGAVWFREQADRETLFDYEQARNRAMGLLTARAWEARRVKKMKGQVYPTGRAVVMRSGAKTTERYKKKGQRMKQIRLWRAEGEREQARRSRWEANESRRREESDRRREQSDRRREESDRRAEEQERAWRQTQKTLNEKRKQEERQKQEEEKTKQEEVKRKQEEEKRKQEEVKRKQEEMKRKQEEEKRKQEEVKRKQEEETRKQEGDYKRGQEVGERRRKEEKQPKENDNRLRKVGDQKKLDRQARFGKPYETLGGEIRKEKGQARLKTFGEIRKERNKIEDEKRKATRLQNMTPEQLAAEEENKARLFRISDQVGASVELGLRYQMADVAEYHEGQYENDRQKRIQVHLQQQGMKARHVEVVPEGESAIREQEGERDQNGRQGERDRQARDRHHREESRGRERERSQASRGRERERSGESRGRERSESRGDRRVWKNERGLGMDSRRHSDMADVGHPSPQQKELALSFLTNTWRWGGGYAEGNHSMTRGIASLTGRGQIDEITLAGNKAMEEFLLQHPDMFRKEGGMIKLLRYGQWKSHTMMNYCLLTDARSMKDVLDGLTRTETQFGFDCENFGHRLFGLNAAQHIRKLARISNLPIPSMGQAQKLIDDEFRLEQQKKIRKQQCQVGGPPEEIDSDHEPDYENFDAMDWDLVNSEGGSKQKKSQKGAVQDRGVRLIQIYAGKDNENNPTYIFFLKDGEEEEVLWNSGLAEFIENPHLTKYVVGSDDKLLKSRHGLNPKGFVNLQLVASAVIHDVLPAVSTSTMLALNVMAVSVGLNAPETMCCKHLALGPNGEKQHYKISTLFDKVNKQQDSFENRRKLRYAAYDAYAGLHIARKLQQSNVRPSEKALKQMGVEKF